MSLAMNVVAAMAESAPIAPYSGPTAFVTNAVRYGAEARIPAQGRKIDPMESMPLTNSCPSSHSGLTTDAMQPTTAHAMIT